MKIGENIDLGVQPLLLAPMEDVNVRRDVVDDQQKGEACAHIAIKIL